jgi:hypothetical protein
MAKPQKYIFSSELQSWEIFFKHSDFLLKYKEKKPSNEKQYFLSFTSLSDSCPTRFTFGVTFSPFCAKADPLGRYAGRTVGGVEVPLFCLLPE